MLFSGKTSPYLPIAQKLGLEYQANADKAFSLAWAVLPELQKSGRARHVMFGPVQDHDLTIFQSSYTVQTGQAPIQVSHAVYSVPVPGWPDMHITRFRRGWLYAFFYRKARRERVLTGDGLFDGRRVVKCADPGFAQVLLTQDLRSFLLEKDSVAWRVVGERLCLIYRGNLRADRIEESIQRLYGFVQCVPNL